MWFLFRIKKKKRKGFEVGVLFPCARIFAQSWRSDIWLWPASGAHTSLADARILSGNTLCFPAAGISQDWLVDCFLVGTEVKDSVNQGNIPEVTSQLGENSGPLQRTQPRQSESMALWSGSLRPGQSSVLGKLLLSGRAL